MGPVCWKKCFSEILSSTKSDEMISLAGLFQPLLKVIEPAFARDLEAVYNCVRIIDWGSVGYDGSRRYGRSYSGTQLGHGTRASTTTERESISVTLADIACFVAVQQHLRYQNKYETTKTAVLTVFSDYDGRKQLVLHESESSLLVQRIGKPLRSSPGGSAFRSLSSRSCR